MNNVGNPRSALTDHLDSSIERVKQNLEAVSFWAHAVSGFSQPIPAYVPEECVNGFQAHPIMAAPVKPAQEHAPEQGKRRQARRRA
jgi:hypothetical protein